MRTNVEVRRHEAQARIEAMRDAGRAAFERGAPCVPALDPAVIEVLAGLPVGTGAAPLLRAWLDAWTTANLATPVEDPAPQAPSFLALDRSDFYHSKGKTPALFVPAEPDPSGTPSMFDFTPEA